jgi:putative hemolysin
MRSRVDMITCSITDSAKAACEKMRKFRLTKMPVYSGDIDNITGIIYFRDLLINDNVSLNKTVRMVNFVPEQKTVESMLEFFLKSKTDIAIVVDEYGGLAGSVILEDIAEELFGQIENTSQNEPIEQTGPFKYRLRGNLAVHDWVEIFGIDLDDTQQATIGGLITTLLGKIPQKGDTINIRNLKFTVESTHRNRIETLILSFEAFNRNDS